VINAPQTTPSVSCWRRNWMHGNAFNARSACDSVPAGNLLLPKGFLHRPWPNLLLRVSVHLRNSLLGPLLQESLPGPQALPSLVVPPLRLQLLLPRLRLPGPNLMLCSSGWKTSKILSIDRIPNRRRRRRCAMIWRSNARAENVNDDCLGLLVVLCCLASLVSRPSSRLFLFFLQSPLYYPLSYDINYQRLLFFHSEVDHSVTTQPSNASNPASTSATEILKWRWS
jgi:hypothetical protein